MLWNQVTTLGPEVRPEWLLVQAAPTAQQCEEHLKHRVGVASKSEFATGVEGNMVSAKTLGQHVLWRFISVPDTIDPRGPKGK